MATRSFETALEAWRRTRSPRFAAIVDAISSKEPERELVGTSGKKVDVARWFALAEAGDWRDMPRLIATIASGNSPQALERVNKLAERDDPRLVPGLLALAESPPYTAGTSKKFWQALVAALEASRDPRARDGMIDLSKRYKTINDTHMGAWVAGAMSKAAAKIGEPPPLDAKQEAALRQLEIELLGAAGATAPRPKAKASTSPEEMFAAIVEAPDDDDARLVYADLLAEQGQNDRAELIVLQVERAAGRGTPQRADLERTKYTATKRTKEWGVPVSAAADDVRFERGFPHHVNLSNTGLGHVADAVEWGTVRSLERVAYAPANAVKAFFDGGRGKNLRQVSALLPRWLDKLRTATFPWTHVGLINEKLAPAHLARFPDLTHLELSREGVSASLFAALPNLESFELDDFVETDSADLFRDNPKLTRLVAGKNAKPDRFSGLRLRELHMRGELDTLEGWLEAVPTLREVHVRQRAYDISKLADLFDRHPTLQRLVFTFAHGSPGAELQRSGQSLALVAGPGPRWVRYYAELAEAAEPLKGRAEKLVLYPPGPRHLVPGISELDLAVVEPAWPNIEVRELL